MNKHEEKQQKILETAFRVWGSHSFRNSSLSQLAAAHGMTKQALYVYFKNKNDLELAMERCVAEKIQTHTDSLIRILAGTETNRLIETYVEHAVRFIRSSIIYIQFLFYRHRQHGGPPADRQFSEQIGAIVAERTGIPAAGIRYLRSVIIQEAHTQNSGRFDFWRTAWYSGFGLDDRMPEFRRVFSDALQIDFSAFGHDPLIRAVFETVMEEADSGVSVGQVARKAGLSKSSLYNYWSGKDAMLSDTLKRQIQIFTDLANDFLLKQSRASDRLFAYLAFAGAFLLKMPEVTNYIQKLVSPGGGTHESIQRLNVLTEADTVNLRGCDTQDFLGLINLAGFREIKYHLAGKTGRDCIEQSLEQLYYLISGGVETFRRQVK